MLPGFNHNLRRNHLLFHVQTEDRGMDTAIVVTQVFLSGQVMAQEQWHYQFLREKSTSQQQLDVWVLQQMKTQHVAMLRRVSSGELDGQAYLTKTTSDPAEPNVPVPRRRSPSQVDSTDPSPWKRSNRRRMPSPMPEEALDEHILREIDAEILKYQQVWRSILPKTPSSDPHR